MLLRIVAVPVLLMPAAASARFPETLLLTSTSSPALVMPAPSPSYVMRFWETSLSNSFSEAPVAFRMPAPENHAPLPVTMLSRSTKVPRFRIPPAS